MAAIDVVTIEYYYRFIEKTFTSPLDEKEFKQTVIAQRITQASSWMEHYCRRPLIEGSTIDVPEDDAGDEITRYQPYDSLSESASPSKPITDELKEACCWLIVYYGMKAEHFGMSTVQDDQKSKTYRIGFPNRVKDILNRGYKYYPTLDTGDETIV